MSPIDRKRLNPQFARRRFLETVGAGAALAPFVPILNASGQERTFPKRLILFFTPHGTILNAWKPTGTENDFQLSPILAPLERHKKKIAVLSGLEIRAPGVGAPHTKGPPLLWTASPLLEEQTFIREDGSGGRYFGWNSAPSVDQVIAQSVGASTPYRSLELGVRSGGSFPGARMIYRGPRQPLPPESSPYSLVGRLFAGTGGASLDQVRAERRSTIDVVKAELDSLRLRAGREEKRKLDAHLEAIRGIETRLTFNPVKCEAPMVGTRIDTNAVANTPTVLERQMDVLAAALACDLTRVASLQFRVGENDNDRYTWLDITYEGHHLITHAGDTDMVARAAMIKIYNWYADRFAYLLDRLDAVKEGTGTMLDNSLVVWGSELGKGNSHAFTNAPFVVAGACGGAVRTGRFLDHPTRAPHNRVLVAMCHAMGLANVETFGATDLGKGPLPRLLA